MKITNLKISGGYASMNESVDTAIKTLHHSEVESKLISYAEKLKSVNDILSYANETAKDVGKVPFSRIINNLCSELDELLFRIAASIMEVADTLPPKNNNEKLFSLYGDVVRKYLNTEVVLFKYQNMYGISEYNLRKMINSLDLEIMKDTILFRNEFKTLFSDFDDTRSILKSDIYDEVNTRNIVRFSINNSLPDNRSSSTDYYGTWLSLRTELSIENSRLTSHYREIEQNKHPYKDYFTEQFPIVVNFIHSKFLGFSKDPLFDSVDPELTTNGEVPDVAAIAIFNMIFAVTSVYLLIGSLLYTDLTNCIVAKQNAVKFEEIKPEMLKALGLDA